MKIKFNFAIVILSFCISSYCQFEYFFIDSTNLALGYVTFFHIIYYFRVTLIYQELTLLLSDLNEIFNGHIFIIVGMWFIFYLNEKHLNLRDPEGVYV